MIENDCVSDLDDLDKATFLPSDIEKVRKPDKIIYFHMNETFSKILSSISIDRSSL